MGSFNTFCAMTRQIITPSEEVYIIPLVKQQGFRSVICIDKQGNQISVPEAPSNVYNFDHYLPVGVMFSGCYVDYGRCDLDENLSNKLQYVAFKEFLSDSLFKVEQGSNEYHEQAVDPTALDKLEMTEHWETLADLFHSQRLFVRGMPSCKKIPSQLCYMVVTKKYADIALKMYTEQSPTFYEYNGDTSFNDFFKLSLKGRYKHFLKYLKEKDSLSNLMSITQRESIHYMLSTNRDNGSYISKYSFEKIFKQLVDAKKQAEGLELFASLHGLKNLVTFFQAVNLTPTPMWYASQDYSNISGFLYSIFMEKVHKSVLKEQHQVRYESSDASVDYKELTDKQLIKERLEIFTKDY